MTIGYKRAANTLLQSFYELDFLYSDLDPEAVTPIEAGFAAAECSSRM